MKKQIDYPFHSIEEEAENRDLGKRLPRQPAPTYELAFIDQTFLLRDKLRSVRLQLEYLKAELTQIEQNIESTVVIFGSARTPSNQDAKQELQRAKNYAAKYPKDTQGKINVEKAKEQLKRSHYYEEARKLGDIITAKNLENASNNFVVMTGGGPGIMEAANRGSSEAKGKSIGLGIYLPMEQGSNPYITRELNLQFHYFAIRKMHFLRRARALVFFPGGFGTLDELFESLTLMQTGKMKHIPTLLFHKAYWDKIVNFEGLVEEDCIDPDDLNLFQYVESAEEAEKVIHDYYSVRSDE